MTDKLETELAALRARVAELEARTNPPAPPKFEAGPRGSTTTELALSRASLSREAMAKMVEAVPDAMVRQIVNGNRATATLNPLPQPNTTPRVTEQNRSGWREAQPLSNPPGIAIADRLMDAADARERADLIAAEARRRLMK
jgi:hypothetical protein